MPNSRIRRIDTAVAFAASPIISGMMWLELSITGSPAAVNFCFSVSARSNSLARRELSAFKVRIEARAAATVGGGKAVVKMKPAANERI